MKKVNGQGRLARLGRVSLVTKGPFGAATEFPNPTPYRNP